MFHLFRRDPYRVLFEGGLGFQEPPSRSFLSSIAQRERQRWHPWLFTDKRLAQKLAREMSKNEPTFIGLGRPRTVPRYQRNDGSLRPWRGPLSAQRPTKQRAPRKPTLSDLA